MLELCLYTNHKRKLKLHPNGVSLNIGLFRDFYQQLLWHREKLEVIEPLAVREELKSTIQKMLGHYVKYPEEDTLIYLGVDGELGKGVSSLSSTLLNGRMVPTSHQSTCMRLGEPRSMEWQIRVL